MGTVTTLTQAAQFGDGNKALRRVNRHNNDKSAEINYPGLTNGNLWGSLTVRDRSNNPHKIFYAIRDEQTRDSAHIEVLLLNGLKEFLQRTESGLSSFKVIVFINQSPCTDCSANMVQRCADIANLVVAGAEIEFSFVYSKLYAKNSGDNRRLNLFSSASVAQAKYKELSGYYTMENSTEFRLRIRHIADTKPPK